MRWFKVVAIAAGILITFLIISSIVGFLIEAAIAALVVAVIALAIKAAFYRRQISSRRPDTEIDESRYHRPLSRQDTRDVDEALTLLKHETGS